MQKVLLVEPIAVEGIKLLEEYGLHVVFLEDNSPEGIKENVVDADAILVRTYSLANSVSAASPGPRSLPGRHGSPSRPTQHD